MKTLVNIIVAFIFLSSCTKEIEFKEQDFEKKLVLNGLICPDSLISVRVSKTTAILNNENPLIENATVKLFCNGKYVENLQYNGIGRYVTENNYPLADSIYTVQVELDGYPTIRATDTVPQKTYITYGTRVSGNTYDEYGDPHLDYEIIIDDSEETNFYELFFIKQSPLNEFTNQYYLDFQTELIVADPVLRSESELDFFIWTYIFSDRFFNGTQYRMTNKFLSAVVQVNSQNTWVPTNAESYAILRTTTSVYYNYRKFWLRHSNNQQIGTRVDEPLFMSLTGDPTPMYSNVENGYGIFAAYNQTYYKFEEQ